METRWFSLLVKRSSEKLQLLSPADFFALIKAKSKEIITSSELEELIQSGKKLRVKFGIDPTGSKLHLGHAVPLMLLRLFQRRGHDIHLIIGDFTAQIGDPSERSEKRAELKERDVARNMKTYIKQVAPIIDVKKASIHKNSSWLSRVSLGEYLKIVGAVSFGEIAQRDDFRERIKSGAGVSLREANYSSLMGIDSIKIKADLEIGGVDQLLNFMQTRELMASKGMRAESVCVTPILEGTSGDGRKMSKSYRNYVALSDVPDNQFGLIMSIPDALVAGYFISFGDVYDLEIEELKAYIAANPLEAKKELAMLLVALLHGEKKAISARANFERRYSKKEYSSGDEVAVHLPLPSDVIGALTAAFSGDRSKSQIRALVRQGAVRRIADGKPSVVLGESDILNSGDLIKVGKRNLFRILEK